MSEDNQDDNPDDNVVPLVIVADAVCQLCGRQRPICAEMDITIRYRERPEDVFRAPDVKVCAVCCDKWGFDPEQAQEVAKAPDLEPMSDKSKCRCGSPAVIMTSKGPMCSTCAFS